MLNIIIIPLCYLTDLNVFNTSIGLPRWRSAGDVRDGGSIPGSGRSPGVGNGNPLQYSCLEDSMDRGTWHSIQFMNCKESGTTEMTQHARSHTLELLHGGQEMIGKHSISGCKSQSPNEKVI